MKSAVPHPPDLTRRGLSRDTRLVPVEGVETLADFRASVPICDESVDPSGSWPTRMVSSPFRCRSEGSR
jgi:hypothetical protein